MGRTNSFRVRNFHFFFVILSALEIEHKEGDTEALFVAVCHREHFRHNFTNLRLINNGGEEKNERWCLLVEEGANNHENSIR